MANGVVVSDEYREYYMVDTAVGSAGVFTGEVDIRTLKEDKGINRLLFSIREEQDEGSIDDSVCTVVLQFKCQGDGRWQTYVPLDGSTLAIGNRLLIKDDGSAIKYRAGVLEDGFTSGSLVFGFDW